MKKFHECGVDVNQDKKQLKQAMDRAFGLLKERQLDSPGFGQERYKNTQLFILTYQWRIRDFLRDREPDMGSLAPIFHPKLHEKKMVQIWVGTCSFKFQVHLGLAT